MVAGYGRRHSCGKCETSASPSLASTKLTSPKKGLTEANIVQVCWVGGGRKKGTESGGKCDQRDRFKDQRGERKDAGEVGKEGERRKEVGVELSKRKDGVEMVTRGGDRGGIKGKRQADTVIAARRSRVLRRLAVSINANQSGGARFEPVGCRVLTFACKCKAKSCRKLAS